MKKKLFLLNILFILFFLISDLSWGLAPSSKVHSKELSKEYTPRSDSEDSFTSKRKIQKYKSKISKLLLSLDANLSKPAGKIFLNLLFGVIFVTSVLMIYEIIPLASLSPGSSSFLPLILLLSLSLLFSLLFYIFNFTYYFIKKYKDISANNRILALMLIQTLTYLATTILIFAFHTSFSTIAFPVLFGIASLILTLLSSSFLIYRLKDKSPSIVLDFYHLKISEEPIFSTINHIYDNIDLLEFNLNKLIHKSSSKKKQLRKEVKSRIRSLISDYKSELKKLRENYNFDVTSNVISMFARHLPKEPVFPYLRMSPNDLTMSFKNKKLFDIVLSRKIGDHIKKIDAFNKLLHSSLYSLDIEYKDLNRLNSTLKYNKKILDIFIEDSKTEKSS
ncbi:hypothetical protein AB834_04265 [PVC group bacterium (ex Bugula neritina AB1)]|nr:hypothetical protein AB834_04265 [PVC group bacterium (ex Bugula neritina AB1)]